MNIFYLVHDVAQCAVAHGNRHVIKMILETCQLLCSVYHVTTPDVEDVPYKLTHKNHPCAVWARTSLENYNWLLQLGMELCREYTHRYDRVHASQAVLVHLLSLDPPRIPSSGFTPPPQAMPEVYYYSKEDSVEAYRLYYRQEKRHLFAWKRRDMPAFLKLPFLDDIRARHRLSEPYALETVSRPRKRADRRRDHACPPTQVRRRSL